MSGLPSGCLQHDFYGRNCFSAYDSPGPRCCITPGPMCVEAAFTSYAAAYQQVGLGTCSCMTATHGPGTSIVVIAAPVLKQRNS